MSKKDKLIKKLKSKPKSFTIDEAKSLITSLGAQETKKGKTGGSRVKFVYNDKALFLHEPHPGNELKPYQVDDIIEFLERNNLI